MEFRVITADGRRSYNGTWSVWANGVLAIIPDDEFQPCEYLSPAVWREIEVVRRTIGEIDPKPGLPSPDQGETDTDTKDPFGLLSPDSE
jgi:hypothetical protein